MIIVGLTGGIGSGKTTILKMFQDLEIDCYIADIEARKLMNSSKKIKKELIEEFGEQTYDASELNRKYIAEIVFENPERLKILNSIVHPRVHKHFKKFIKKAESDYVIYENAILFESKGDKKCDYIITVTAPIDVRIKRILARDTTTKVDILNRIKNQLSDEEKTSKSDFVINNIDLKKTKKEVIKIHVKILQKIKEKD
ncbi:MAG: dephospho-CoA kinase [Flavobacteriaceae bacterium]|nr:dephospho-CoA kinase [Flavobacteriaceae bacterium]